ncbi:MAG: flippase-like domain-containing protein [Chitinivibrionia bacterium]|nr:flippase-like domain-containing protein [Chitinivibrionia bacterium]
MRNRENIGDNVSNNAGENISDNAVRAGLKPALTRYIFGALIIIALIFIVLKFPDFRHGFLESITKIPLWSIVLLAGIQIITQLLLNFQWVKIAANTDVRVSFGKMLYINSQAEIVHSIPAGYVGSELTRFAKMAGIDGCSKSQAAAVVAAQKIFSLSALFFICIMVFGFTVSEIPQLKENLHTGIFGILLAIALLFACVFFMPKRIKAHFAKIKPKTFVPFFLLSVLIWLIYPLKMYILAAQINPDVGLFAISAMAFISYMVALLPIFPAGLGGFELTMTGLLSLPFIGFAPSEALALTIIFRFITFWFVLLLSIVYIGIYKGIGGYAKTKNN